MTSVYINKSISGSWIALLFLLLVWGTETLSSSAMVRDRFSDKVKPPPIGDAERQAAVQALEKQLGILAQFLPVSIPLPLQPGRISRGGSSSFAVIVGDIRFTDIETGASILLEFWLDDGTYALNDLRFAGLPEPTDKQQPKISQDEAHRIAIEIQEKLGGVSPGVFIADVVVPKKPLWRYGILWSRSNKQGVKYERFRFTMSIDFKGKLHVYTRNHILPECNDKPQISNKRAVKLADEARQKKPAGYAPSWSREFCFQPDEAKLVIVDPLWPRYLGESRRGSRYVPWKSEYYLRAPSSRLTYLVQFSKTLRETGEILGNSFYGWTPRPEMIYAAVDAVTGEVYYIPDEAYETCEPLPPSEKQE